MNGADAIVARLKAMAAGTPPQLGKALYQVAEPWMTEAKRRTPVRYGVLRASGTVLPPEVEGNTATVTMTFGGAAAGYAVYVHERLISNHHGPRQGMPIRHAPPTGAKFLESVVDENAPHLLDQIAAVIDLESAG